MSFRAKRGICSSFLRERKQARTSRSFALLRRAQDDRLRLSFRAKRGIYFLSWVPVHLQKSGSFAPLRKAQNRKCGTCAPAWVFFRRRRSAGTTFHASGRWRSAHPSARLAPPSPLGGPRAAPPARPRALPPKPLRSGRQSRPPLAPLLAPEKPDARFPCPPPPAQERRPHIFRGGPAAATGPGCGGA